MRLTCFLLSSCLCTSAPFANNEGIINGDPTHGREIYRACISCHLPEGWGMREGSYPQIAGQRYPVLLKQLLDMRTNARENSDMHALLSENDTQALADVAAYITRLPMTPNNGVGPGDDLIHGKQIYQYHCAHCHGEHGEGTHLYPLLQDQHYAYLLRQVEAMRDESRRPTHPEMNAHLAQLNERDIMAVLDYISRLRPCSDRLAPPGWLNPDFR
jgi:cytochrome c553